MPERDMTLAEAIEIAHRVKSYRQPTVAELAAVRLADSVNEIATAIVEAVGRVFQGHEDALRAMARQFEAINKAQGGIPEQPTRE